MSPSTHQTVRRRDRVQIALRHLWMWLNGTSYRPERHYMRGRARTPFAGH